MLYGLLVWHSTSIHGKATVKHVAPVGTYLSLFSIVPKIPFTEIEDGTSLGR
jgi:hypothetical protein